MKSKSNVKSVFLSALLLSLLAFTIKPAFAQVSTLKMQDLPPVPLYGPGRSLYLNIYISGVVDIWSINFTLSYDTSILTAENYTINEDDPVAGNGFRNFWATNEINDTAGYVDIGADRGPSGQILNENIGTGDGSNTVFYVDNPRIGDRNGDSLVNVNDVTVYWNGVPQPATKLLDVATDLVKSRIRFKTAFTPPAGTVITVDYFHPGLTSDMDFQIVKIGFSIDSRGVSPLDIHDSQLKDIQMAPIAHDEADAVFDNRWQGHVSAPDYINGAPGDEFDIVITADHVLVPTAGITFFLDYDTNILTATSGNQINDTVGWTYVEVKDLNLITVDPVPLVTVTFMLDAAGRSQLHFRELTVVSLQGDKLFFDSTDGSVSAIHDVAVTDVTLPVTEVAQGDNLPINVKVANQGNFTETFDVTAFYNSTAVVPSQTVTALASGASTTLTFNWDTTGVAAGDYTIKAVASTVPGETNTNDNTYTDGVVTVILGPIISVNPKSGPLGTKLEVTGIRFESNDYISVYFDDMLMAKVDADSAGSWTAVFNVPLAEPGAHLIKAVGFVIAKNATFEVIDTSQMDINIEVGQIHFRGEIAEFYIQTAFKGEPIDATSLTTALRKPDGTTQTLTSQHVAKGLYKIPYTLPINAPTGIYILVAEADYVNDTIRSKGTKIGSFLLSPTLTGWNALLINIDGNVATIKTDVGLVKVKLDDLKAMLININGTIVTIKTDLGLVKVELNALDAKLVSLNNTVATINTNVGLIKTDIATIKTMVTEINGTVATIETDIGTILGKIVTVQGDVATIKTDIGTIKTIIHGWTGGTISDIVTPDGTFNLLTLTTSTLESLAYSDNTISIVVSGSTGTTGKTNVVLPISFLDSIGSDIDQIEATLNDKKVDFTYTENLDTYVLSLGYSHSTHTVKIFLMGIPPQPLLPLTTILIIVVAIVAAASIAAYYVWRTRKKPVKV